MTQLRLNGKSLPCLSPHILLSHKNSQRIYRAWLIGPGNLARSELKPGTESSRLGHAHAASAKTWSSTLEDLSKFAGIQIPDSLT